MKEQIDEQEQLMSCLILDNNLDSNLSSRLLLNDTIIFESTVTKPNTTEVNELLSKKNIDLVIINESGYFLENFLTLKEIHKNNFKGKIIILTTGVNSLHSELYLKTKAHAYISINESIGFICSCIRHVFSGYTVFRSIAKSGYLLPRMDIDEIMILLLLFEDKTTSFISKTLDIDKSLVCKFKYNILAKYRPLCAV